MIEIKPGIYTDRLMFITDGETFDILAGIQKIDGEWIMKVRHRRYVDEFSHNSLDEKNWMEVGNKEGGGDPAELRAGIIAIANQLGLPCDEFVVDGETIDDPHQLPSWMHGRKV